MASVVVVAAVPLRSSVTVQATEQYKYAEMNWTVLALVGGGPAAGAACCTVITSAAPLRDVVLVTKKVLSKEEGVWASASPALRDTRRRSRLGGMSYLRWMYNLGSFFN